MNISVLETSKPDTDLAKEFREELRPHLEAVCSIINRARAHSMTVGFNVANDQHGRAMIPEISVVKVL